MLATSKKLINFYYNFYDSKKLYLISLFNKKKLMNVKSLMPYKNWDKKPQDLYHIAFWVKKNNLITFFMQKYNTNIIKNFINL